MLHDVCGNTCARFRLNFSKARSVAPGFISNFKLWKSLIRGWCRNEVWRCVWASCAWHGRHKLSRRQIRSVYRINATWCLREHLRQVPFKLGINPLWTTGTSCPADNKIWLPNKNYMNVCRNTCAWFRLNFSKALSVTLGFISNFKLWKSLIRGWCRNEAWSCVWASCAGHIGGFLK